MTFPDDPEDTHETPVTQSVGDIYDVATLTSSDDTTDQAKDPSEETHTPTVGDIYDVEAVHDDHPTTEESGQEGSGLKIIR